MYHRGGPAAILQPQRSEGGGSRVNLFGDTPPPLMPASVQAASVPCECGAHRALPRRPCSLHITFKQLLCSVAVTSTLTPPPHPLLLFGPLAVLNPVFCLVFVVNLQTFSA